MKTSEELRPVEALYFLSCNKQEEWSTENALAATLVYLAVSKYIEARKKKFKLTDKGRQALKDSSTDLRDYEIDVLQAIEDKDQEDMVDTIDCLDFDDYFFNLRYFEKESVKFLWLIPYKRTIFSSTGMAMVEELLKSRTTLKSALKSKTLTEFDVVNSYAFPSLAMSNGFKKYAKKVVANTEAAEAIRNTMSIASTTLLLCTASNLISMSTMASVASMPSR